MRTRIFVMALVTAFLLAGCDKVPAIRATLGQDQVQTLRQQYPLYTSNQSMEQALDEADGVVQVEVLHNNALPFEPPQGVVYIPVHVDRALCGNLADSLAVNEAFTMVLTPASQGQPLPKEGEKIILAVREIEMDGHAVMEYDASFYLYLTSEKYLISAAEDNDTKTFTGQPEEMLTETLLPIFHPGENQFPRSTLDEGQREALKEPYLADVAGGTLTQMNYGALRGVLRGESALVLAEVTAAGQTLSLKNIETLHGGEEAGATYTLADPKGCFKVGDRLILYKGQALFVVDGKDQLICLLPEKRTFPLTGITLNSLKQGMTKIMPE